jgi:hypothetical protein
MLMRTIHLGGNTMRTRSSLHAAALLLSLLAVGSASAFPEATPGLLHASLLNGVIVDPTSGALQVKDVQAFNLPTPPNGDYEANAADAAGKLWATLCTADGNEVARLDFSTEKGDRGQAVLSYYVITLPGQQDHADALKLEAGDYVLTFSLATGKFYAFPFSVKVVGGKYLSFGDWNSWGYFLYSRGDVEQPLIWKLWLRRNETGNKDGVETKIEVVRDQDNKVVATSRVDTKQWLTDPWVRYEFDMMHPSTSVTGGGFMKASDLLKQDGAYTLKMSMSGAPYGAWKFSVAGGKFVPAGRTDRATADPTSYVMGGPDAFWYSSQAPAGANAAAMAPPERTFTQKGFIPDCKAVVVGGATLVVIAPVLTFLEAQSQWDAGTKTLSITHGERTLKLTVGQSTAQGNAGPVALGGPPQLTEGDLYAPVKAVALALGSEVEWDAKTKLLTVIDGDRAGMIHVP